MILTCRECETKFLVKAEDLGDKGRKVRCGKCGNVWHQEPAAAEKVAAEKEIVKKQQENLKEAVAQKVAGVKPSLPSVVVAVGTPKWLKNSVYVLVVANLFVFAWCNKATIGQTSFYDKIGQYETKGVVITETELIPGEAAHGSKKYFVQWSVQNNTKEKMDLPKLRLSLLDKDLKVMSKVAKSQDLILAPGQILKFDPPSSVVDEGGQAKYLMLEIGNPYELSLR